MVKKTLLIYGVGTVGTALALALKDNPEYALMLSARDLKKARQHLQTYDLDHLLIEEENGLARASWVLVTVTDSAIRSVAERWASCNWVKAKTCVGHCSGALSSQVLESLSHNQSVQLFSLHPLQTFPSVEAGVASLSKSFGFYEADKSIEKEVEQLCAALHLKPQLISKESKVLYHAAAVMACNYLPTLMQSALELGKAAGIAEEDFWQALSPLVHSTLNNIDQVGTEKALTGPIARGDVATLKAHQAGITDTRFKALYNQLGEKTLPLATGITSDQLSQMKALFIKG
jgi:predicted short-subunit dehydrogenase-like oxidoreductase (DUF2520 family)